MIITDRGKLYQGETDRMVQYILYSPNMDLLISGKAEKVEDGHFWVTLDKETTARFNSGVHRLKVITDLPADILSPAYFEFMVV